MSARCKSIYVYGVTPPTNRSPVQSLSAWVASWGSSRFWKYFGRIDRVVLHVAVVMDVCCEGRRCFWARAVTDPTADHKPGDYSKCGQGAVHCVSVDLIMRPAYSVRVQFGRKFEHAMMFKLDVDDAAKDRVVKYLVSQVVFSMESTMDVYEQGHTTTRQVVDFSKRMARCVYDSRVKDTVNNLNDQRLGLPKCPTWAGEALGQMGEVIGTCMQAPCYPSIGTYNIAGYFCTTCGTCSECDFGIDNEAIVHRNEDGTLDHLDVVPRPMICSEMVMVCLMVAGLDVTASYSPARRARDFTPVMIMEMLEEIRNRSRESPRGDVPFPVEDGGAMVATLAYA